MTNNVSKLPVDELAWVWAYREQLNMLDKFDAELLRSARDGWTDNSRAIFFNEYRLNQGAHAVVRRNAEQVWGLLLPLFDEPLSGTDITKSLLDRWKTAVEIVDNYLRQFRSGNSDKLWSMTSKLLWFHQPTHMTMYDKNARNALQSHVGQYERISPENYLFKFDEFFNDSIRSIENAARFSDRKYPFARRVADGRLWLLGNPKQKAILDGFRESLRRAPLSA